MAEKAKPPANAGGLLFKKNQKLENLLDSLNDCDDSVLNAVPVDTCESRNNLIDAEVLEECYDSIYNDGDVIHYFGTSFAFNVSLIITLSLEFVHKKINFRKNFFILSISDIANKPFYTI